jgi:hypothetical protein
MFYDDLTQYYLRQNSASDKHCILVIYSWIHTLLKTMFAPVCADAIPTDGNYKLDENCLRLVIL